MKMQNFMLECHKFYRNLFGLFKGKMWLNGLLVKYRNIHVILSNACNKNIHNQLSQQLMGNSASKLYNLPRFSRDLLHLHTHYTEVKNGHFNPPFQLRY